MGDAYACPATLLVKFVNDRSAHCRRYLVSFSSHAPFAVRSWFRAHVHFRPVLCDSIDESEEIARVLTGGASGKSGRAVEIRRVFGSHVTPCGADLAWEVGKVFTPADAIAQAAKVRRKGRIISCRALHRWQPGPEERFVLSTFADGHAFTNEARRSGGGHLAGRAGPPPPASAAAARGCCRHRCCAAVSSSAHGASGRGRLSRSSGASRERWWRRVADGCGAGGGREVNAAETLLLLQQRCCCGC